MEIVGLLAVSAYLVTHQPVLRFSVGTSVGTVGWFVVVVLVAVRLWQVWG